MLKEKMVKEQMRLNTLIEKKDIKIKSQNNQIIKMKSFIKCQKSRRAEITEKTGISIKVEDISMIRVENERLHHFYAQGKSHTISLKRQPKFTKGSERPKFQNTINKMRPAISCQNLSTLKQVTRSFDSPQNLMASSSDIISDKDSGFGSFRSDKLSVNYNNYEEKSAAKYSAPTEKCKRRERRTSWG
jgi:hypothetical protein